jgi:hypothetical protein
VATRGTQAGEAEQGDLRAERRLSRNEQIFWYGFAAVTYVVASIIQKGLSNWFVGPMWLVAVVWFGPLVTAQIRRRRPAGAPEGEHELPAQGQEQEQERG